MRLRPYQPGEESTLWELYQGLGLRVQSRTTELDHDQWIKQLRAQLPFVVEYDNQVIGYVSLESDGEIGHFFVRQSWHDRGVGTLLMHKVHQQAAEQGVRGLRAFVCQQSIPFFASWGFVPELTHGHTQAQDGMYMRKSLVQ